MTVCLGVRRRLAFMAAVSALIMLGVWTVPLPAADPPEPASPSEIETVELFSGIEAGAIEVRLIAKDSTEVNLLVTNKSDRPLSVVLPAAMAGVPVLAQFFDDQFRQDQQPQPLGVANNQGWPMNQQANNPRNPGPLWNIAPEKVGKITLPAVCLEHGRPNPRPKFAYEPKPIDEVTQKQGVAGVVGMLGRGEIGQRAAQLAVWRLNNDLSWADLAGMKQKASIGTLPVFSRTELEAAKKAVKTVLAPAEESESDGAKPTSTR